MNTLLIEIIACLFAAAFLSLFIGWAIRSMLANKEVEATNAHWEAKNSEQELRFQQETEHLQGKVDRLETESTQLSTRNDNINESLRENELSIHKARTDAIELNRQQAETQERLQTIIAQKDEELRRLRSTGGGPGIASAGMAAAGVAGAAGIAANQGVETEARIAALSAKKDAWDSERSRLVNGISEDQATVAIDPIDLPSDPLASDLLDQTIKLDDDSDRTVKFENDQTMLLDGKAGRPNRKPGKDGN